MAIDLNRVLEAAAQAAVEGQKGGRDGNRSDTERRRGFSAPRAFLLGAGIVTAGRVVTRLRDGNLLESVRERLLQYEERHFRDDDPRDELDEEPEEPEDEDEPERRPARSGSSSRNRTD